LGFFAILSHSQNYIALRVTPTQMFSSTSATQTTEVTENKSSSLCR
jgi:hypothetical protein